MCQRLTEEFELDVTPLEIAARLFHQRRLGAQRRGPGMGRKPIDHITADLRRELDSLTAILADKSFLLGEKPYLCDFASNAHLAYMSCPPGSAEALREFSALGNVHAANEGLAAARNLAQVLSVRTGNRRVRLIPLVEGETAR